MTAPVLSVRNLQVEFLTRRSTLRAIDGISFDIAKGEVLGVVGESGAGKSVTGLAVIGLIDPPGRIAGGEIYLSGMPEPRNDSVASVMMANARLMVAMTRIGPIVFGSTWRSMITGAGRPINCAAAT